MAMLKMMSAANKKPKLDQVFDGWTIAKPKRLSSQKWVAFPVACSQFIQSGLNLNSIANSASNEEHINVMAKGTEMILRILWLWKKKLSKNFCPGLACIKLILVVTKNNEKEFDEKNFNI